MEFSAYVGMMILLLTESIRSSFALPCDVVFPFTVAAEFCFLISSRRCSRV